MRVKMWGAIAPVVVLAGLSGAARADDPHDPAMRSAAARARDQEQVRTLNRDQLAMVRQRDAGYAEGWAAVRAARGVARADSGSGATAERGAYERALEIHAREQADYERDMARWRRTVAACQGGDWSACER